MNVEKDTICALATPNGIGAIGVVRLSGPQAIDIANQLFHGKDLSQQASHSLHFGTIREKEEIVDEVLISLFKGPNSYTGEDVIEFSCHGSSYILERLIQLCLQKGARLANPGEFTLRAFGNGKLDLAQAEAVADLIASSSKSAHQLAMHQMRGGFSEKIDQLREELIHFASLIELELDFSEEDVEFADRNDLKELVEKLQDQLYLLIESFRQGNVIKTGIPVAIIGEPNVGKSTLLNALLNEEKAIVSEIAGTTRDVIEDEMTIDGIRFRFIDTAGIRQTEDTIESIGIERTFQKVDQAAVVLYLVDAVKSNTKEIHDAIAEIQKHIEGQDKQLIVLANKVDIDQEEKIPSDINTKFEGLEQVIYLSALKRFGVDKVTDALSAMVQESVIGSESVMVSNARHHEALRKSSAALSRVQEGLNTGITGDFLAMDIRQALFHLGEITGKITTDDLLGNIFSKFCIGK